MLCAWYVVCVIFLKIALHWSFDKRDQQKINHIKISSMYWNWIYSSHLYAFCSNLTQFFHVFLSTWLSSLSCSYILFVLVFVRYLLGSVPDKLTGIIPRLHFHSILHARRLARISSLIAAWSFVLCFLAHWDQPGQLLGISL